MLSGVCPTNVSLTSHASRCDDVKKIAVTFTALQNICKCHFQVKTQTTTWIFAQTTFCLESIALRPTLNLQFTEIQDKHTPCREPLDQLTHYLPALASCNSQTAANTGSVVRTSLVIELDLMQPLKYTTRSEPGDFPTTTLLTGFQKLKLKVQEGITGNARSIFL